MEREVDPNAVTQEGKDQGNKRRNQKQTNGDEKQSSNQGRDKVAKQKYKVQIKVKVQIKHGKNAKKSKTYQIGNRSIAGA